MSISVHPFYARAPTSTRSSPPHSTFTGVLVILPFGALCVPVRRADGRSDAQLRRLPPSPLGFARSSDTPQNLARPVTHHGRRDLAHRPLSSAASIHRTSRCSPAFTRPINTTTPAWARDRGYRRDDPAQNRASQAGRRCARTNRRARDGDNTTNIKCSPSRSEPSSRVWRRMSPRPPASSAGEFRAGRVAHGGFDGGAGRMGNVGVILGARCCRS